MFSAYWLYDPKATIKDIILDSIVFIAFVEMTLSDTDSNGKRFHVLLKLNGFQPKSSWIAFDRFIMHLQPGLKVIKIFVLTPSEHKIYSAYKC